MSPKAIGPRQCLLRCWVSENISLGLRHTDCLIRSWVSDNVFMDQLDNVSLGHKSQTMSLWDIDKVTGLRQCLYGTQLDNVSLGHGSQTISLWDIARQCLLRSQISNNVFIGHSQTMSHQVVGLRQCLLSPWVSDTVFMGHRQCHIKSWVPGKVSSRVGSQTISPQAIDLRQHRT